MITGCPLSCLRLHLLQNVVEVGVSQSIVAGLEMLQVLITVVVGPLPLHVALLVDKLADSSLTTCCVGT